MPVPKAWGWHSNPVHGASTDFTGHQTAAPAWFNAITGCIAVIVKQCLVFSLVPSTVLT